MPAVASLAAAILLTVIALGALALSTAPSEARAQNAPFTAYGVGLDSGDVVSAFIGGELCGSTTVDGAGQWILLVRDSDPCDPTNDATIGFTLNGATAEETATWSIGGTPATSGFDPNVGIPLTVAATPTPTPEPTEEPTPEPTAEPTATATPSATTEPTATAEPTATSTPTATSSPGPTSTATPTATAPGTSTPATPSATSPADATATPTITIRPIDDPTEADGGGSFVGTFGIIVIVLLVLGGIGAAVVLPRLRRAA